MWCCMCLVLFVLVMLSVIMFCMWLVIIGCLGRLVRNLNMGLLVWLFMGVVVSRFSLFSV